MDRNMTRDYLKRHMVRDYLKRHMKQHECGSIDFRLRVTADVLAVIVIAVIVLVSINYCKDLY